MEKEKAIIEAQPTKIKDLEEKLFTFTEKFGDTRKFNYTKFATQVEEMLS